MPAQGNHLFIMKRLTLLLLPLTLALFLAALTLWLPGNVALAAEYPQPETGTHSTTLPRPALQSTETITATFYLGAPIHDFNEMTQYAYCSGGGALIQERAVWVTSFYPKETMVGVIVTYWQKWGKPVVLTNPKDDGRSFDFGTCEAIGGEDGCSNSGYDIAGPAGFSTGGSEEDAAVFMRNTTTVDGEGHSYQDILAEVWDDDYIYKGASQWPSTGIFTDTLAYFSLRYIFHNPFVSSCENYSGTAGPLNVTIYPIYYGVDQNACDTCVTEADSLSSGTVGSTAFGFSTTISSTYMLVGDPSIALSWDQEYWFSLTGAGEPCGTLADPDEATIYLDAISSTLYLQSSVEGANYEIFDASCLSGGDDDSGWDNCEDFFEVVTEYCRDDSIVATSNAGEELGPPALSTWRSGEWYMFETKSPPYFDNPSPPHASGAADLTDSFDSLPNWASAESFAQCVADPGGGYVRTYFQYEEGQSWGVRAHEGFGDYMDNTGSLNYMICGAEYTPPPAPCEANYNLVDLFTSGTVAAERERGYYLRRIDFSDFELGFLENPGPGQYCMNADSWYALETQPGPWYECDDSVCTQYTDLQISTDDGATWYDLQFDSWPGLACVVPLADNYVRAYFRTDHLTNGMSNACDYKVRVNDKNGDFSDNTLSVDYEIWTADILSSPPITDTGSPICEDFALDTKIFDDAVLEDAAQGEAMPSPESGYDLIPDQWYALETHEFPDTPEITSDALLPDSIRNWYQLEYWPGAACVQTVLTQTLMYFKVPEENVNALRYRVNDILETESAYSLWTAERTSTTPPTCGSQYDFTRMGDSKIPAQLFNGVAVDDATGPYYIEAGNIYRIDTTGGPWDTGDGTLSYDVDISADGGATWYPIYDFPEGECMVNLGGGYYRVLFEAQDGAEYRLRVSDGDNPDDYLPNLWDMEFVLYFSEDTTITPPPGDPGGPGDPGDPGAGCNVVCFHNPSPAWQGSGILDFASHASYLGDWLSYVAGYIGYTRCNFSRYVAWCPYHTEVVMGLDEHFVAKEPYGTLYEFISTYEQIKAEIESYNWGDGESGGETSSAPILEPPQNFFLAPQPSPTPGGAVISNTQSYVPWETGSVWSGDDLEWDHNVETYSTTCVNAMADSLGPILSPGVCYATNALEASGLNTWFNWVISGASLFALALYMKNKWIDDPSG